ncbi:hypothetical protein SAMN04487911_10756 [Arenibacter nanhaiticus]|uniref:Uncharacterized protein n=1 Tax=Arenibacter nanhaiticus TaxID=558155 RepID=A0A1M6EUD6_9FLAO|nr:hypothetical protein [Arenibacter nanhaiticus]SHI89104.1 hypothetical protein SAMN04487911_10756 [Arenibacter nanhaiticus]
MKNIIVSLFFIFSYYGMSQSKINNYKYIIVPAKFEAFKSENQYLTSTLMKQLFVENGFTAVYDNDLPEELMVDRCKGLLVRLLDDSSLFTTKVKLSLTDCANKEVFITGEGRSKEKEYRAAYSEAIKNSFKDIANLNYAYTPKDKDSRVSISFKDDVVRLQDPAEKDKDIRFEDAAQHQSETNQQKVVQQKATLEEQYFKSMEPVSADPALHHVKLIKDTAVLYAQKIPNGYQLVDSTPKITMKLYHTSLMNFYIAKTEQQVDGIVYKKGEKWIFEYYQEEELINKELNIKF